MNKDQWKAYLIYQTLRGTGQAGRATARTYGRWTRRGVRAWWRWITR